jgi:succinylglutamate desuccinylase
MKKTTNIFEMYPTIQIETLLANPLAHVQNKRFVDVDLNRQFGDDSNSNTNNTTIPPSDDNCSSNDDATVTTTTTTTTTTAVATTKTEHYEVERAREIEILLGKRRWTMIK